MIAQHSAEELNEVAALLCVGTPWTLQGVQWLPTKEAWEFRLQHKRGDWLVPMCVDSLPLDAVVAFLADAVQAEVGWPDWQPGDPVPQLVCDVPTDWEAFERQRAADESVAQPTIVNFEVGARLTVVGVDYKTGRLTLACDGPWNLP